MEFYVVFHFKADKRTGCVTVQIRNSNSERTGTTIHVAHNDSKCLENFGFSSIEHDSNITFFEKEGPAKMFTQIVYYDHYCIKNIKF